MDGALRTIDADWESTLDSHSKLMGTNPIGV